MIEIHVNLKSTICSQRVVKPRITNLLVLQVLLTVTVKVTLWRLYLSKLNATNQWGMTFRRPWGRLNDKGLRDVSVWWLKNIESVVMLMMGESSQVRSASPDPPLTVYPALMSSLSA